MKIRKIATICISTLMMNALMLTGCGESSTVEDNISSENSKKTELTIAAAASLKEVTSDIETTFEAEHKNIDLIFTYGGSGSLQQQIEQGSPTDVFISAGSKQMEALENEDLLLDETREDLLTNKIVLIAPSNTDLTSFQDLNSNKITQIGFGEPGSVPVGQYTEQVLKSLGILDSVNNSGKVVYAKDVKEVLTWVETGNIDAGVVYETDAKASNDVKIICEAPEGSHEDIIYPVAVIKDSKSVNEAKEFVEFLNTDDAKSIFESYGFTTK